MAIALLGAANPSLAQSAGGREYPVSTSATSPIEPARQSFGDEDWAKKRAGEIDAVLNDAAALRAADVLFLGDSITQFWLTHGHAAWRRSFADSSAPFRGIDLGFAGDRTENLLLHLVERSAGGGGYLDDPALDPDSIVLLIGVNNSWKTEGPIVEDVVAGNIAAIARLRRLRPRATLIVQSLLPAQDAEHTRKFILPINRLLRRMVQGLGPKVRWLDIYPLFAAAEGAPAPELFVDGVHPSARGYEIWSAELLKALRAAAAAP